MGNPYTAQSISGYNANAPADDGTASEANRVKWATVKDELADPLKTLAEGIDTAITAAFGERDFNTITSTAVDVTVTSDDIGELFVVTGTTTVTAPAASSSLVGDKFYVLNDGSATVTIAKQGSDTIDGLTSLTVDEAAMVVCISATKWYCLPMSATATTVAANSIGSDELADANDPLGLQTIWVPASAMISRTTNGAASGTTESTTNKVMNQTFDFDTSADEFVQFTVGFPKGWNEGTLTAKFAWTAASGSGTVQWAIQAVALANDDAIDTAFGTAVLPAADTLITALDVHVTAATGAITVAGSPSTDEVVYFQIYRDVSGDNLGVDAKLIGAWIYYTIDAANDT